MTEVDLTAQVSEFTRFLVALRLASRGGRKLEQRVIELLEARQTDELLLLADSVPKSFYDDASRLCEAASTSEIEILNILSPAYPVRLRSIEDPPALLFVWGRLSKIYTDPTESLGVGIVGSRRATGYGRRVAGSLSAEITRRGGFVVSGLALGIDTAAHGGALEEVRMDSSCWPGIGVLGGGISRFYPKKNLRLAAAMVEAGGVIVSEYLPHSPPLQQNFLERNRIISGLSDAVVVIEAPERSGALSTVRHALSQGREVLAVPGEIDSPMSKGSNLLIRAGCIPCIGVDDILHQFPRAAKQLRDPAKELPPMGVPVDLSHRILASIRTLKRVGIDVLAEKLNVRIEEVRRELSRLELEGKIFNLGDGTYSDREFIDTFTM